MKCKKCYPLKKGRMLDGNNHQYFKDDEVRLAVEWLKNELSLTIHSMTDKQRANPGLMTGVMINGVDEAFSVVMNE